MTYCQIFARFFLLALFVFCAAVTLASLPTPGDARIRGGGLAGTAPFNPCPNGTAYAAIDGCLEASEYGTYYNPNMNDLIRDANGNQATLLAPPGTDFNVAGRDFPVGPRMAPGEQYIDPFYTSFTSTGSTITGGNILTVGTVTQGYVADGMTLFSAPLGAGGNIPDKDVVLSNCSGHGSGAVCTLSRSYSNRSGDWFGSFMAPCKWGNGTGTSGISEYTCDFRVNNDARTANFSKIDFCAVGGHTRTRIRIPAQDGVISTLIVRDSRFCMDSTLEASPMVSVTSGVKLNAYFEWNDCSGGNEGIPVGSPSLTYPFREQSNCFGWGSEGTSTDTLTVSFRFNYIHDYAGNPIQISNRFTDAISQANVFDRIGLNNGDTGPGCPDCTGFHGATINWNSSTPGSISRGIKRYNDVAIYPYGFRPGVTTAPFAILGGVGSQSVITEYDQQLTTAIMNNAAGGAGRAISEFWIDFLRVGKVEKFTAKKNFVSTLGVSGCYALGADVGPSGWSGPVAASAGNDYSVWTLSGIINSSAQALPFPGQAIHPGSGSTVPTFRGTLSDNGDGTSTLTITNTIITPTNALAAGGFKRQIIAQHLEDIWTNPTLIQSGSGTSYIVRNINGIGETRAEQVFRVAQVINPFGTNGTTATVGPPHVNSNGTWSISGEYSHAGNFFAIGTLPDNYLTLSTDVAENYDMLSGSLLTAEGIGLVYGSCPGAGGP